MSCINDNSCGCSNIITLNRMWVLWVPHVAAFVLLLSYTTFFCCDSLCSLPVSFSEETWGTGVLPKLGHTHSCCPDIHIVILPFVSSNFLPSCQGKCLQRHHPMFKVANMHCSKEEAACLLVMWSNWNLAIHLLVSIRISPLWAALGILSKELNFGKFTLYHLSSLFCYFDSFICRWWKLFHLPSYLLWYFGQTFDMRSVGYTA